MEIFNYRLRNIILAIMFLLIEIFVKYDLDIYLFILFLIIYNLSIWSSFLKYIFYLNFDGRNGYIFKLFYFRKINLSNTKKITINNQLDNIYNVIIRNKNGLAITIPFIHKRDYEKFKNLVESSSKIRIKYENAYIWNKSRKKINKYLSLKEESQYNNLDRIFNLYIDGYLIKILMKYGFSKIECFSQIKKDANYLQINFWYYNLVVFIEFDDLCFDYCIYLPNNSVKQLEESIIESSYTDDFILENFIYDLHNILEEDNRLKKY